MSGELKSVYDLASPEAATEFYDDWAAGYEAELAENGYATPMLCAKALAKHATLPWAPLLEVGCGTGLGGLALRNQGFECIDGGDISPEMLARAEQKGIYRSLSIVDLSKPLDDIPEDVYQNAAAIGVLNPSFLPGAVIDEVLARIPAGGCFVLSLNDHARANGTFETRIIEITEHQVADLVFKEHGANVPGIDLEGTVYVLKKR